MTTATRIADQHRLSPEQVEQFHRDGYLAPLTACSPEEMADYRAHIERVLEADDAEARGGGHNRHLDDATIWRLSTLPGIVGPMQSVLGEDLLLWRTNFFVKKPGAKAIPWHQDRNYWPLEPEIVVSAWVAIDKATVENSAVQVVPGTHRKLIKHVPADRAKEAFAERADTDSVDLSKKVDLELEPGQFILFNERTLHHSEPNTSNLRRIGLAVRAIIPQVRVLKWDSPEHRAIQISGRDPLGFNEHIDPPTRNAV